MRRPTRKLILFFLLTLVIGYVLSFGIMIWPLETELRLYGFWNVTGVAVLIAVLLLIWLDRPFNLGLFKWPEQKPKRQQEVTHEIPGTMFPHETPGEHWEVDFGDSKQVYQGADLPVWILAGWAAFILWAVIYLASGLPNAF